MDRFIVFCFDRLQLPLQDLKSNMDRFIVVNEKSLFDKISDLKSNMDRFIVSKAPFYMFQKII